MDARVWSRFAAEALFDGDKGTTFTVLLVALMIAGAVLLIVNLANRNETALPPGPAWQPIEDPKAEPTDAAPATRRRR